MANDNGDNKDHLGKKLDKLIVGAVIGGAIGSVIGLTLAPKKGKETREAISKKTKEFFKSHKKEISTAKKLTKETLIGAYKLIRNSLRKKD